MHSPPIHHSTQGTQGTSQRIPAPRAQGTQAGATWGRPHTPRSTPHGAAGTATQCAHRDAVPGSPPSRPPWWSPRCRTFRRGSWCKTPHPPGCTGQRDTQLQWRTRSQPRRRIQPDGDGVCAAQAVAKKGMTHEDGARTPSPGLPSTQQHEKGGQAGTSPPPPLPLPPPSPGLNCIHRHPQAAA
jgi:hypothetical protein